MTEQNDIKILTINIDNISTTSIYKPLENCFAFVSPGNLDHKKAGVITGDFNSHNVTWGYSKNYENANLVEMWTAA